jgi:hypothetical protein
MMEDWESSQETLSIPIVHKYSLIGDARISRESIDEVNKQCLQDDSNMYDNIPRAFCPTRSKRVLFESLDRFPGEYLTD